MVARRGSGCGHCWLKSYSCGAGQAEWYLCHAVLRRGATARTSFTAGLFLLGRHNGSGMHPGLVPVAIIRKLARLYGRLELAIFIGSGMGCMDMIR